MMSLPVWLPGPMFLLGVWTETPTPWTKTPPGQRPFLDRDPLYSKERAVHILLECILVTNCKGRICFHKGLSVHGGVGYLWSQVPSR